jgi:hypothetical protein
MSEKPKWLPVWLVVCAVVSYWVASQLAQSVEVVQKMSFSHEDQSVNGNTAFGWMRGYKHEIIEALVWFSVLFISRLSFDRGLLPTARKLAFVIAVSVLLAGITDIKLEEEVTPDREECYMFAGVLFMTFGILPVAPYLLPPASKTKRR